jgi:membrane protein involved in D-alanine export
MRFLLTAGKKKWFTGKHTASYLGLLLTFGLMGVWHGLAFHYILYGLYHAALLIGYDWFARWNKTHKVWGSASWQVFTDMLLTFHSIAFGLLLFSGRLTPPPPPAIDWQVEKIDAHEVVGFMWQSSSQGKSLEVDLYVDDVNFMRVKADLDRPDLRDRGYGKGRCGFRLELPWWVRDGRPHTLDIREAASGTPLKGVPPTIEFERNEEEIERGGTKIRRAQESETPSENKPNQSFPAAPPVPK